MADFTKKIIFIVLYWAAGAKLVSAYCEWSRCKLDEECCGDNKCCPRSDPNEGYYILAWVSIAILITIMLGIILYKVWKNRQRITGYWNL